MAIQSYGTAAPRIGKKTGGLLQTARPTQQPPARKKAPAPSKTMKRK